MALPIDAPPPTETALVLTNGTHLPVETVLQRIQAYTTHYNAIYWREKLMHCHVPPDAPADEWESGIHRVATIFYKPAS